MATNEVKRGIESLKHDLELYKEREPGRATEWQSRFDWAVARAQQYADYCHTTREKVLEAWEEVRDYWFVNFYQDSNQPDLSKGNVQSIDDWVAEGRRLYGEDKMDWKFKCPMCGHVQTAREFKEAGKEPYLAYQNCASRHGLGGRPDCKWTVGGLFRIGGRYVIDEKFVPHLIFDFADSINKEE